MPCRRIVYKTRERGWRRRSGREGRASLSHRSAFCGMCRLIMLKANNNNNKSNKWLQLSMRQKRRQTRRVRMVIDTIQRVALALPTPWFIWSSLPVPLGNLYRQLTDNCSNARLAPHFSAGKPTKVGRKSASDLSQMKMMTMTMMRIATM